MSADEPEIKLARKVVERLELKDFTVRDYENPGTALLPGKMYRETFADGDILWLHCEPLIATCACTAIQRFYAHLQAVALDREAPEEVIDYTAPPVCPPPQKKRKHRMNEQCA